MVYIIHYELDHSSCSFLPAPKATQGSEGLLGVAVSDMVVERLGCCKLAWKSDWILWFMVDIKLYLQ
jgi:hypothetical protein